MHFYCKIYFSNTFTRGILNYTDEDAFAVVYTLNGETYAFVVDVLLNYIVDSKIPYAIFEEVYLSRARKIIKTEYPRSFRGKIMKMIKEMELNYVTVNRSLLIINLLTFGYSHNVFSNFISDFPRFESDIIINEYAHFDETDFIEIFCDLVKGNSSFRNGITLVEGVDFAPLCLSLGSMKKLLSFEKVQDIANIKINDLIECLNIALRSIREGDDIETLEEYSTLRSLIISTEKSEKVEVTLDGSNLDKMTDDEILKLYKYISHLDDPKYDILKEKVTLSTLSS